MNRLVSLVGGGMLLCSSLVAGALPAAAQPGGPCSLVSDDALSQALGSPAHAIGLLSNASAASAGGPAVADMCVATLGGGNVIEITHAVGVQSPGDAQSALSASRGGPGAAFAAVDPALLTTTPITGLGDTAVLLSGTKGDQPFAYLIVWRGTESFTLIGSGLPDLPTSLPNVAQAVLAGQPAQP